LSELGVTDAVPQSANDDDTPKTLASSDDETTQTDPTLFRRLDSWALMNNGQVSFHGPTSILNPSILDSKEKHDQPFGHRVAETEVLERRQRLVVNAWQQRSLELFSNMPVSDSLLFLVGI
jgi:hypothetical protein